MKIKLINSTLFLFSFIICTCLTENALNYLGFNSYFSETYCPNNVNIRRNNEFNYNFTTNSQGLREKEISKEKKQNEIRVLFLGDSFTEGVGVNTEERFSDLISKKIKLKDKILTTINAAITATGPTEYARMLTHIGMNYSPDIIVVGIFANDIHNVTNKFALDLISDKYNHLHHIDHSLKSKIKLKFGRLYRIYKQTLPNMFRADFDTRIKEEIKRRNISLDRYNKWREKITLENIQDINSRKVNDIVYTTGLFNPEYFIQALELKDKEENFNTITKTLDYISKIANEAKIIILYLPSPLQIHSKYQKPDNPWINTGSIAKSNWLTEESKFELKLKNYSAENNLIYISVTDKLRTANNNNLTTNYSIDGHMNAIGHKIVADELQKILCKEIKCENYVF